MLMIIRGESTGSVTFLNKQGKEQTREYRRLSMLTASGELAENFFELDLGRDHPPVGAGKQVEVRLTKVIGFFNGVIRVTGELVEKK